MRTVQYGPVLNSAGKPAKMIGQVSADTSVHYDPSDVDIMNDPLKVVSDASGVITFPWPRSDQPFMSDGAGNPVVDFTSTFSFEFVDSSMPSLDDVTFLTPGGAGPLVLQSDLSVTRTAGIVTSAPSESTAQRAEQAAAEAEASAAAILALPKVTLSVRDYGAIPDPTVDVAPVVNAMLALIGSTPTTITFPATKPGESYGLLTDINLSSPNVSLQGTGTQITFANTAKINVGADTLTAGAAPIFNSVISGFHFLRDNTAGGNAIPSGSRFLVLKLVRNLVIERNHFRGAETAVYIPANANSGLHTNAFNILRNNQIEEVDYAVYGTYSDAGAGGGSDAWTAIGDWFIIGNIVNRAYITAIYFRGCDGLVVNDNDFVNINYLNVANARIIAKRNNILVEKSDWVHIHDNQMYEAGHEAIKLLQARTVTITGNLIAWPGQLDLKDAIYIESFTGFFTRVVITGNAAAQYTKSAVTLSGTFSVITMDANAFTYSAAPASYIGVALGTGAAQSSISHYRYDVSLVASSLKATQIQLPRGSSGLAGESDKLPSHTYTTEASLKGPFQGTSTAVRTITTISGATNIFPLSDLLDVTTYVGCLVVVTAISGGFSSASKKSTYILLVSNPGAATLIAADGLITGAAADDPAFTWARSGTNLVATPVGITAGGPYQFIAASLGNGVLG